ncbi:MAG: restriction endonuclease subunit S [Marinobacter sp.]|nr:restriction endonuclease subunit S [Marinobacter sp.]
MFEERPLGSLIERHAGGGTPSRQVPGFWKGKIPWASVKDFKDDQSSISETEEYISEDGLRASASNLIPENTVLICSRMAVGRAAISKAPIAINQDLKALFPKIGVDQRYLLRILQWVKGQAENLAVGSTVKGIRLADLLGLEIPVAPEVEQPTIANILDTLDTQIRQTEAIIAKLQQVKQGLLHDLLTRGIDANGQLRPPRDQAPELYKESPLGWIPREWEAIPLSKVSMVKGGKRLPAGHDYATNPTKFKYLRVTDFFKRTYRESELESLYEETFAALVRYEINPGEVYISIAGSIGFAGVHELDGVRTILTENAARLIPKQELNPRYVSLALNSHMLQRQIEEEKGTGGGVPKLALFRIEALLLPFPAAEEQKMIEEKVLCMDSRISRETALVGKLKKQKSGLMDDLLTGRVRVTSLLDTAKAS